MLHPYLKKYMVTHSAPIIIAGQDFTRSKLYHENYKHFIQRGHNNIMAWPHNTVLSLHTSYCLRVDP